VNDQTSSGTPPDRPSRARIFSYLLGGYDWTEADRAMAGEIERINPAARDMLLSNRLFASRAVRWAMDQMDQVIDLSCGFPLTTGENIHEAARSVHRSARVAYVDDDPEVTDSWDVRLDGDEVPGVAVVAADFADPDAVLGDAALKDVIDLGEPVLLLFALALSIMPPARAAKLVAAYAERIAPGSCVAISTPCIDDPAMAAALREAWQPPPRGWNFTRRQFAALFAGLELVPPGIAPAASLRPGWETVLQVAPGPAYALARIGIKPRSRDSSARS
jgi:hypothetical protein